MSTFQVRLFPEGAYEKVEAANSKAAAEKKYGSELHETGSKHQLRALVHPMAWPRGTPILFYSRD